MLYKHRTIVCMTINADLPTRRAAAPEGTRA
jgi:hypothetical protein